MVRVLVLMVSMALWFCRLTLDVLPDVLVFHLKRFKFADEVSAFRKLLNHVTFPLNMKLVQAKAPPDSKLASAVAAVQKEFDLFAVVVHIGRYLLLITLTLLRRTLSYARIHPFAQ